MHACDRLHRATVAMAEPAAIYGLHAADVRRAVIRDRNLVATAECARHAGRPQQLAPEPAMDEGVHVAEELQRLPRAVLRWRHELRERFGVIGGDVRMGERRA